MKKKIIGVCVIVLAIIQVIPYAIAFPNVGKSIDIEENEIDQLENCKTPKKLILENQNNSEKSVLIKYTENMKNYMDDSVDPCNDFYQYACANWEKYNPRPKGYTKLTVFNTLEKEVFKKVKYLLEQDTNDDSKIGEKKAKMYYSSCLRRDGVEPLLKYFNTEFGGWPVLMENWNESATDWIKLVTTGDLFTKLLIFLYISPDLKNPIADAIYIDEPQLGLINPKYYLDKSKSSKVQAYKDLISNSLEILGAPGNLSKQTADEIIELETVIASLMRDPDILAEDNDEYHKTSVQDLNENYPEIDWENLIESYLGKPVTLNQTVIVCNPEYVKQFAELISRTNLRIIANYVSWRIANTLLIKLDERFSSVYDNFNQELYGVREQIPHWQKCVSETMLVTEWAVASIFVKKYFNEANKEELIKITGLLKNSFLEIIKESDWLDFQTKKAAIRKLHHVRFEIGYQDDYLNGSVSYENFFFKPDNYFENHLHYKIQVRLGFVQHYFSSNLIDAWDVVSPLNVDAYHLKVTNQVIFPAAILQPPIYHPDFPNAIKFGVVGSFVGHELTHAFDSSGRKYDFLGRMKDWWSNNSTEAFLNKAKCFIEQYSNYTTQGHHVNGETSQGENIADAGGLIQSFRAYKKWLSENYNECQENEQLPGVNVTEFQLFFLAYAQTWCFSITPEALEILLTEDKHTPANIRLNGVLRNSEDFAEVYNCPVGSFMNPENKCKLW